MLFGRMMVIVNPALVSFAVAVGFPGLAFLFFFAI